MGGKILRASSLILALGLTASFSHADDKKIKIAIAGDSTVASYTKPEIAGWGQIIGKYFKDNVSIENFAISGRSTKTFQKNGDWQKLLDSKPDYIFVQFGHNDSHAKDRPEATDAATEYKDNLRKFADDAKKIKAEIIFVTPMYRRTFTKDGKLTDNLLPYANAMKEVAKEKGALLIDLHTSSGKLVEELGEEKSKYMANKLGDRTHFSPAGADKMAQLIVDDLKKTDSELKKYLK